MTGECLSADCFFFFQAEDGIRDLTVTGVQTCALPILTIIFLLAVVTLQPFAIYSSARRTVFVLVSLLVCLIPTTIGGLLSAIGIADRKSTRLNSSHSQISYAVFCLKKKKNTTSLSYHPSISYNAHASRTTSIPSTRHYSYFSPPARQPTPTFISQLSPTCTCHPVSC